MNWNLYTKKKNFSHSSILIDRNDILFYSLKDHKKNSIFKFKLNIKKENKKKQKKFLLYYYILNNSSEKFVLSSHSLFLSLSPFLSFLHFLTCENLWDVRYRPENILSHMPLIQWRITCVYWCSWFTSDFKIFPPN